MAKSSEEKPAGRARAARGERVRRSPLTDFHDASEPLSQGGFGEAPQRDLAGEALRGPVGEWADAIAREAVDAPQAPADAIPSSKTKTPKKIPARSSAPTRTARGTSMGGAASAKERAAAGLNPVAGLDISLEDAGSLSNSGVTATVAALSSLIESGNPLHKNGQIWTPHRPARPEKSEGGIASSSSRSSSPPATSRPPSTSWSTASRSRSATRCCSASPAPARPSPWRR